MGEQAAAASHRTEGPEQGLARILVIDDDPGVTDLVATVLRYEGFSVQVAATGREGLQATTSFRPHLLVLDVMLPDGSGFEIQERLAAEGADVPIVFLTARDATEDKVRGLLDGADDYMTKPFRLEELVARIRSVLRRNVDLVSRRLVVADLEMDEDTHEVWRAGEPIDLSPTEFNLLRFLMLNPRRVVSKSQILSHVWRYDFQGDASVVETYVSYLRKKIDRVEPKVIHTVRGVGYTLRLPRA